jgi:hypothetical protein
MGWDPHQRNLRTIVRITYDFSIFATARKYHKSTRTLLVTARNGSM